MEHLAMKTHTYALESKERVYVPLFLAAAGMLAALALHMVIDSFKIALPWWLDAPSLVGFYGLFHRVYNERLWRSTILRRMTLASTPNLNGHWEGHLTSSFDEHASKLDVKATIVQSWTKIAVELSTPTSDSHSIVAALSTEDSGSAILSYEYVNEPRANAESTMQMHRGFASLIVNQTGQTLDGIYFSGRGRQNYGSVYLRKTD